MRSLDQERDVVDLAKKLGFSGSAVSSILGFCQDRVDQWVAAKGGVETIDQLESIITHELGLTIEEIQSEEDAQALKKRYAAKGELVFLHIVENDLTPDTFGTMVRCRDGSHVAIIDARGEKAARRFFTRWHEIAHLLVEPDCERQVFRSNDEPLERLMDLIAGNIGFLRTDLSKRLSKPK